MFKKMTKIGAIALVFSAGSALANPYQGVVRDYQGDPVRTYTNDCVETNWTAQNPVNCGTHYDHANKTTKVESQKMAYEPAPKKRVQKTVPRDTASAETVFFEFDSANLTDSAKSELRQLANRAHTSGKVFDGVIVGYADPMGGDSYNQELSADRAAAVSAYLNSQGIPTRSIEVRALGEQYASTNCSEDMSRMNRISCLSDDRRVEVQLKSRELQQVSYYK